MKKSIFKLVLLVIFISSFLLSFKPADASGMITIDTASPTEGATVSGYVIVSGLVTYVTSVDSLGVYISNGSVYTLTQSTCNLVSHSFSCQWNTKTLNNGNYLIVVGARIDGESTFSYSQNTRNVTIYNTSSSHSTTNTDTTKTKTTPTPVSSPTPKVENPTPTPEPTTTTMTIPGRPDLSPIPVAIPAITPTPSQIDLIQEKITNSSLIGTIEFKIFQDKPLNLRKIEARQNQNQQKFFLLNGRARPDSFLTITIHSQPLVMTTKADVNGNWNYVLEQPLEPGQHEVYLEVNSEGVVETSGPFPFNIARAQATAENPNGSSFEIVDPSKHTIQNYILIALGVISLSILILLIYLYLQRIKKLRTTNTPSKGVDAV